MSSLLEVHFEAREDVQAGLPICAQARIAAAQNVLFLSGLSWQDIDEQTIAAQNELLQTVIEMGTL